jgi:eukaryotic-like serine/threonine-protein kinase
VQGAGPGTLLGGRYALRQRLAQGPELERWSAHDTTLEREVALTIVDSDHPNRAGVVDAARRAAGVEDTRLVRILDVGSQDGSSFIVEESTSGWESLATILVQGAQPADEARRIAGETARALETAGQRGLHHLRLTPHSILIAQDGAIRIGGVAVAAAIDGLDEPDPTMASRRDALCVVAVMYAALTGRWPLDEQISGIKPAPRVAGGVAAPSELVAGVPGDLDSLCRRTLNEGTGPSTPGDFAAQIAPWPHERVHRNGVEPTMVLQLPGVNNAGDLTSELTSELASQPQPGASSQVAEPSAGDKAAAAGAAATKAVGNALANAGAAASVVGGKLGSFAKAAADQGARAGDSLRTQRMPLPAILSFESEEVRPPLPMLPASTGQPPGRHQTRIVVLVVVTFLALALLVGYFGARDLGKGSGTATSPAKAKATPGAAAVPTPASPASRTGPTLPAQGRPIAILSATGFDPDGDKSERNNQAAKAYDGDPETSWTSEGYNTADFGALKKGVGVILDLGQPTSTRQAILSLGSEPLDVTVFAATQRSLEDATVIGSARGATGRVQLDAASTMPEAQYVIVWFTSLAPAGGQFRASIAEIALS